MRELRRNGEKYAVFAGFRVRRGGFEDLIGYGNTIEEAMAHFDKGAWHGGETGPYAGGPLNKFPKGVPFGWVQIIDLDTGFLQLSSEIPENYKDQKRKDDA